MSDTNPTSKTATPTEIRLAVEWLARNANGVTLVDWEPRSQTLLTAADQIEAMASVGIRQEREIERLRARLQLETAALELSCAAPVDQPITISAARGAVETTAPLSEADEVQIGRSQAELAVLKKDGRSYEIRRITGQALEVITRLHAARGTFGEIAQLRRIDKAARTFVDNFPSTYVDDGNCRKEWRELTEALFDAGLPEEPSGPASLVGALQDRIHTEIGITRPAHAVNGSAEHAK